MHLKGLIALFSGATLYASMGLLMRAASAFAPFQQTLIRNFFILLFAGIALACMRRWVSIIRKDAKWFLAMGSVGVMSVTAMFIALNGMALSLAILMYYLAFVVWGIVLGVALHKETVPRYLPLAAALALMGIIGIFYEPIGAPWTMALFAALGGMTEVSWNAFSKKLSNRYPLPQISLIDALLACLFSLPIALALHQLAFAQLGIISWLAVGAAAFVSLTGGCLVFYGYGKIPVSAAGIVMLFEIIVISVIDALLLQTRFSLIQYLGLASVLSSIGVLSWMPSFFLPAMAKHRQ